MIDSREILRRIAVRLGLDPDAIASEPARETPFSVSKIVLAAELRASRETHRYVDPCRSLA